MKFTHVPNGKADLPAGKKDEESLKVLFTMLEFNVNIHQNLTADQIVSEVQ